MLDHLQKSWSDPKDSRGQGSKDSSEMLRSSFKTSRSARFAKFAKLPRQGGVKQWQILTLRFAKNF
jgi:hypothetical protein